MVWQPDVVTEIESMVSYDPTTSIAPQPEVVITLPLEVVYTTPASTGGQPNVITEIAAVGELGEMQPYTDINGTSNIVFTGSVTPSIDVELVEQPATVRANVTRIVSINYTGTP